MKTLDLKQIYAPENSELSVSYNKRAMYVLAFSFTLSMIGAFLPGVPFFKLINDFAFFSGLISSFVLYTALTLFSKNK